MNWVTQIIRYLDLIGIVFFLSLNQTATSSNVDLIRGKHLRVIWPNWKGNPKGLSGPIKGQFTIDYLAARFHFTYEFVRVTENWMEPLNNGTVKGQFNYLWNDEADLLMTPIVPRSGRQNVIDITSVLVYDGFALLIPVSDEISSNYEAIIKPFQWPIWILLFVSITIVTFVFRQLQKYLLIKSIMSNTSSQNRAHQIKLTNPYMYVFGNILSQGGSYTVNRLPIRLIACAWSLAAFVFVQAYNSTLITYVLAPNNSPLVKSFHELAERSDLVLWMRRAGTLENMLYSGEHDADEFMKKLKLRASSNIPESRCTIISECMDQVKPGLKNVYADGNVYHLYGIRERFRKTGKCDIEIIGNDFMNEITTFGLQKNSPYTTAISEGLTELKENGIYTYWDVWIRPYPYQCTANVKGRAEKEPKDAQLRRLTLKNLTGAFVVLSVGLGLSFLVFLCERFIFIFLNSEGRQKRQNTGVIQE